MQEPLRLHAEQRRSRQPAAPRWQRDAQLHGACMRLEVAEGGLAALNGGQHGTSAPGPTLVPLHGGCQGGQGGPSDVSMATAGGAGGGALQISAAKTLSIYGTIAAAGGGGGGAQKRAGG